MEHRFTKQSLEAVLYAASTDASRYNLSAVHLTENRAECTDGFRLHRVTFAEPIGDGERTIKAQNVRDAIKAHGKAREPMRLNGNWEVGDGATLRADAAEGEFPRLDMVIPLPETRGPQVTLNARLLRDACDAAIKLCAEKKSAFISIEFGADSPAIRPVVLTTLADGITLESVIMPVKA